MKEILGILLALFVIIPIAMLVMSNNCKRCGYNDFETYNGKKFYCKRCGEKA